MYINIIKKQKIPLIDKWNFKNYFNSLLIILLALLPLVGVGAECLVTVLVADKLLLLFFLHAQAIISIYLFSIIFKKRNE